MHPSKLASIQPGSAATQASPRRRSLRRTLLSVALAAVTTTAGLAQEATGTVSGRVLNASNGTYMPNVVVRVPGTNLTATTNNFGEYELRNVPAGTASLQVEYMGLDNISETVTVSSGTTTQKDFTLGEALYEDEAAPEILGKALGISITDWGIIEPNAPTPTDVAILTGARGVGANFRAGPASFERRRRKGS